MTTGTRPYRASNFPRRGHAFAILLACLLVGSVTWVPQASGQVRVGYFDFMHPDLKWYTIETEHFRVHFHADSSGVGSSRTAQVVARIAEDVYPEITGLYGHEPDTPVSFILKDYEDYSNGAAYFFDNMIEIWAPALDTPFRGDHAWLRNVITHEFTHMVQVQKTMKANRRLPFLYFQYLDYEDVRRPDVLYGYPNVIGTYPIPILNNPAWLAEGTAQYQRTGLDYDRWDSHRDMMLRTRVLAGTELSLRDMGGFYSHTSLGRESVYNHGFAFTQYIAATRGEEALRSISEALAHWSTFTFERATKTALGIDGSDLYDEWMAALRSEYTTRTEAIRAAETPGETVSAEGFLNAYPKPSPDGSKLAWTSNAGQDFSLRRIHVLDLARGTASVIDVPGSSTAADDGYTCSLGNPVVVTGSGGISWNPDGTGILYARTMDRPDGHLVSDIWEVDVATRHKRRISRDLRANDPTWSPDGTRIAFVGQADGTSNLYLLDPTSHETARLTGFVSGEQVSDPSFSPDGEWVWFAVTIRRGRDIWRVRPDGSGLESVIETSSDERQPTVDASGRWLWYSSDADGIYNLYRLDLTGESSEAERITNVVGGAFHPQPDASGGVYFARYEGDGYRIARLGGSEVVARPSAGRYEAPPFMIKRGGSSEQPWATLNAFDDTDLRPFSGADLAAARSQDGLPVSLGRVVGADSDSGNDVDSDAVEVENAVGREFRPSGEAAADASVVRTYSPTFTSFSFLPVLRLDQYVSRRRSRTDVRLPDRTRGETLLRNTKLGVYAASREVLPGMSMFGGVLFSPASRSAASFFDYMAPSHLLGLERDVFLQFDYARGLGIIPKRWSPQFSLELYNVSRNVANGLSIEEFPCTACYPDTTLADLSYNLWEVDFSARAKVNRSLLLETTVRYSPYQVTTERFFSKELNQTIPESGSNYFIGQAVRLWAYFEAMAPHRHDNVIPEGLRVDGGFERETGKLLSRFDVEDGLLKPIYERSTFVRMTVDARMGRRIWPGGRERAPHGVATRVRVSTILGGEVNDFYNDYAGGLVGARGYPFYALGGNKTIWAQAAYTFPLLTDISRQVGPLYLDKVYARVYADAAAAWTGPWSRSGGFRKDAGVELRIGLGSFYLLPTAVFVSGTYGFDAFDFQLDEGFVTPDGLTSVRYGRELQWHAGVLFGFDLF